MGTLLGLRRAPARVTLACALAWLAWPGDADAETVKFIFHAEDGSGRTAWLKLTYQSDATASLVMEEEGIPGGFGEFSAAWSRPMRVEARLDGRDLVAWEGPEETEDFIEAVVLDQWWPPYEYLHDSFGLYVSGDSWGASIYLVGSDPSAIIAHRTLPRTLDLDKFEIHRELWINGFRGTITAIVVPEPASLALAACGFAGAAAFAGLRRRRAA